MSFLGFLAASCCRQRMAPSAMLDVPSDIAPQAPMAAAAFAAFTLLQGTRRRIFFSNLDQERATEYLRSYPTQAFNLWSDQEWQRLGATQGKLEFSTEPIDNGIRLVYYFSPAEARSRGLAGLVEDGGFDLFVQGNSIVGRARPGKLGRRAQEEVVWQRLVLQITKGIALERAGGRPDFGTVQGIYPCSMEKEIAYMSLRRASDSLWKRY